MMKRYQFVSSLSILTISVLFFCFFTMGFAQDPDYLKFDQQDKELVRNNPNMIIWNVKALLPSGQLLNVKAIDKDGQMHPVKAIQNDKQTQLLDFKAFIHGEMIPIKLLLKENEKFYPLKAIQTDGTILDVKAITEKGEKLAVKGISQSGNIIHVQVVLDDDDFYNVIAISPQGEINIVKGIKMFKDTVESTVSGVKIFAHVKAIKQ